MNIKAVLRSCFFVLKIMCKYYFITHLSDAVDFNKQVYYNCFNIGIDFIKGMIIMKICSQCGSQQQDDAAFCNKCGSSFNNAVIPPQQVQNAFAQPQQQSVQSQQFNQMPQPQIYQYQPQYAQAGAPGAIAAQNGSRKKLIIIISAIAAAVAVVLLILFLFVFKSKKDLIVGTWAEDGKNGSYTRFNKDGTVELELGNDKSKAVYKIDGDSLIITRDSISMNYKIDELTADKLRMSASSELKAISVSFTKVNDDDAIKSYTEKSKLKTANSNAKLVFRTINNEAADCIADGESVAAVHTGGVVAVADLKDSSDPLLNAVYKALRDNGEELGYVYIDFDMSGHDSSGFVQWSASESGGLIGQYPNPVKTVEESKEMTFGQKKN